MFENTSRSNNQYRKAESLLEYLESLQKKRPLSKFLDQHLYRNKNINQNTVARRLEVSDGTISHWLKGRSRPSCVDLNRFCVEVGMTPNQVNRAFLFFTCEVLIGHMIEHLKSALDSLNPERIELTTETIIEQLRPLSDDTEN